MGHHFMQSPKTLTLTTSPQLLDVQHLTKSFGARIVLNDLSLIVNRGDRLCMVGENGSGKTTFAKILAGHLLPDSGSIKLSAAVTLGYLPQAAYFDAEQRVGAFLEAQLGEMAALRTELAALELALAQPQSGDALAQLLARYGTVQEAFQLCGGYESDHQLESVLHGLHLDHIDPMQHVQVLSGGEKTRLALAGLLLSKPTLLMLDEPTNHLDMAALAWLERYLLTYTGAIIAISHDRKFLNKVATHILAFTPDQQYRLYHGNYDFFLHEREHIQQEAEAAYQAQQEEIKSLQQQIKHSTHNEGNGRPPTDNDKFAKAFFAGRNDVRQARELGQAKKRLELLLANPLERPLAQWRINPTFAPNTIISREIIRFQGVSKAFDDRVLFRQFTATIYAGERIVLQGPNGIGKSTLIKLVMGLLEPDAGMVKLAAGAQIGYLDQEQEVLDDNLTVLEAYSRGLMGTEAALRAELHQYGVFSGDQALQRIGTLSVGQRRKLQIARIIATRANVLLLDEPTNHLDLESLEQFEAGLKTFNGTIFAITHDRAFAERVATTIWHLRDAQIVVEVRA